MAKPPTFPKPPPPLSGVGLSVLYELNYTVLHPERAPYSPALFQKRCILGVYFDVDNSIPPCYMCFPKTWVVGKVLDKVCTQGAPLYFLVPDSASIPHAFHIAGRQQAVGACADGAGGEICRAFAVGFPMGCGGSRQQPWAAAGESSAFCGCDEVHCGL